MLLFCYINLVKFKIFWLSNKFIIWDEGSSTMNSSWDGQSAASFFHYSDGALSVATIIWIQSARGSTTGTGVLVLMVRRPRKLGIGEVKNDFPSQNVGRGPIKSKPAVTGLWTPVKYFLGRWGLGELFRSNKYYRFPPKTKKKQTNTTD
jgi:hypothetical protein